MKFPRPLPGMPNAVVALAVVGLVLLGVLLIMHGSKLDNDQMLMAIIAALGNVVTIYVGYAIGRHHKRTGENEPDA